MKYLVVYFFCIIAHCGWAQFEEEGLQEVPTEEPADTSQVTVDELADEKNGLKSLLIPGWGQVNNGQYLKGGLFLVGTVGSAVLQSNLNGDYKVYRDAYSSRLNNYDNPIDQFAGQYSLEELYEFRREELAKRDLARGGLIYIYSVNIIDAAAQYKIIREDPEVHSATKAAYYSIILPGLGQAYNKKYWKVPIVYGALGASIYVANQNRDYHRRYQKEIEFRSVGETTGFRQALSDSKLESQLQYWRKWRDAAYLAIVAVYGLNVLDATVDAQLIDFNVDDDLSFVQPAPKFGIINGQPYYAVQLTFTINQ